MAAGLVENVFTESSTPALGAGEGAYYLVGLETPLGVALGDMTSGPRVTTNLPSCP